MSDQEIDYDFPEDRTLRKTRLVVGGILLALMGTLAGLLGVFYLLVMPKLMGSQPGMAGMSQMMVSAGLIYGLLGLVLLIPGLGSIFLKRWARPLCLILSWYWIYCGVIGLIAMLVQYPRMQQMMIDQMDAQGQQMASQAGAAMAIGIGISVAFLFLFGVMLPGLLIWLYSHRDVKATVEFCDRKHRWTDRCPTPVLGITVACVISAVMMVSTLCWVRLVPAFGKVYEGRTALLIMAGVAVSFLLIAWGAYRQQIWAWLALVAFMAVGSVSAVMTFPDFDWGMYYRKMGFPEEQIDQMVATLTGIYDGNLMLILGVVSALPIFAYLIWVLRSFVKKDRGLLIAGEGK